MVAQSPYTQMGLSFAQSSVSDWKEGEKQNLEIKSSLLSKQRLDIGPVDFTMSLRFKLGVKQQTTETNEFVLPTDNELFGEGLLKLPLQWRVDPYISASFRTQVTESFRISRDKPIRTAKLWDPVTSQQGMGFTYLDRGDFGSLSTRIGVSLKQIRAEIYTTTTDDRKTRDVKESYKAESGIEFINDANLNLDSAISYRSRMGLFGTFDDLEKWTIRWENEIQATVWRFIAVTLSIDIYYDEKQSIETQFRQSLTLGVIHKL